MNIQYCLDKAREIPYIKGQSRHWCAIYDKRGKLISEAGNSYCKTHPIMSKTSKKLGLHKEYCHAEVLALLRSKGKGCKLVVVRVDNSGDSVYSKPCIVCETLIMENFPNIKSIEYSI